MSSSCQSFQVTAHNCWEASGVSPVFQLAETWGQGCCGSGTVVCLCVCLCVWERVCVLPETAVQIKVPAFCCVLWNPLRHTSAISQRGGLQPPARGSLPSLQLILHQKYTTAPCWGTELYTILTGSCLQDCWFGAVFQLFQIHPGLQLVSWPFYFTEYTIKCPNINLVNP